ncbi:hypothetical protein K458DRAFT_389223 [Lentithecium fluviatile CBS 122367]|uniref:Uncharacterized protein n=1 Tax=Lentithecium fluviatile CBS 122367 TaxID=1168545 RepID=A0A6G1J0G7_9PLEO|nr:hypothetical protein K458DRAFT_389223 [Lentithecium fluviatile CBS 122367]
MCQKKTPKKPLRKQFARFLCQPSSFYLHQRPSITLFNKSSSITFNNLPFPPIPPTSTNPLRRRPAQTNPNPKNGRRSLASRHSKTVHPDALPQRALVCMVLRKEKQEEEFFMVKRWNSKRVQWVKRWIPQGRSQLPGGQQMNLLVLDNGGCTAVM